MDLTELLESGQFYDTEILVGEESNSKIFRLHSLILKVRSTYFRTVLSEEWIKVENNIVKYQKPNISVEVFDIIMKYVYSDKVYLTDNIKTNVDLLIAADELLLEDLCTYTEEELLKDKESLKSNFVLILNVAKFDHFVKLSQFYRDAFKHDPSLIFKADDFTTIKQEFLLDIFIKNEHSLKPIEIWNKLMEWAIAQTNELSSDITEWTVDNISTFRALIEPFIPHIDFKRISPFEFSQKIKPLKDIFDNDFYVNILEHYSFNDAHLMKINSKMEIDSKIINSEQAFSLANFIKTTKRDAPDVFYKFVLRIRGSRDGFGLENMFYNRCEEVGPTITLARVKNTNEILGGFNLLKWKSYGTTICTKENFIFSLDINNLENSIFSRVKDENKILRNYLSYLIPDFGDLCFLVDHSNKGLYKKKSYEKSIRKNEGEFEIDDYEVFEVKVAKK